MNELFQGLNGLYILLTVAALIGGFFAGRRGYSKEIGAATAALNETLEKEIEGLRRRLSDLENDRAQQDNVIRTIRLLLKDQGFRIIISGKTVTLQDQHGSRKTTRVQGSAPVTPIASGDDDDAV